MNTRNSAIVMVGLFTLMSTDPNSLGFLDDVLVL